MPALLRAFCVASKSSKCLVFGVGLACCCFLTNIFGVTVLLCLHTFSGGLEDLLRCRLSLGFVGVHEKVFPILRRGTFIFLAHTP